MIIKELVTQIRGVSYKPTDVVNSNKGIPILRANNINNDAIIFDDLVYVNPSRINEKQYLKKGDILICTSSGSKTLVGKAGRFESYSQPVAFGAFCKVLRVNDNPKINKEYIRLFFRSSLYRNMIAELSNGANINNIKTENIDYLNVNVPSIEIQSKAVSLFESLIKALNQKKYQLDCLEELINSRFVEMFGTPNNSKGYPIVKVKDVAEIQVGVVIKPAQYYTDTQHGVKAFRSLNVGEMTINDDNWVYFNEEGQKKNSKSILKENDLVVVRSGTPGTACVVTKQFEGSNAVDVIIAHPNIEKINPYYLCAFTNLPHGKQQIENGTGGAAQQHFNVGKYKEMDLIYPPKFEQDCFVSFIEQINKSKSIVKQQIKDLQELLDKKMDECFNS